jgi:type VI secretion system protein ImpE
MSAEELLRQGRLSDAFAALKEQVRKEPANAKLRVFLFQMFAVQGDWERALTQLNAAAEMDASTLAMAQMYREALSCEALRAEVFAGLRTPLVFGEPPPWLGLLLEALRLSAAGSHAAAQPLRDQAFEAAPATSGSIDGHAFDWLADADVRLGPVVEAVVNGRYYWIPLQHIQRMDVEPPVDLRDLVWMPVHFTWANGGESVGVIPTRYPGSERAEDEAIRLARKTAWEELAPGVYQGIGQRMLTTDTGEYPLMEVRQIHLNVNSQGP